MSLVSVIIPTKNSSRTIQKCLQSVAGQSYQNLEIIIVDGKSTDDTVKISQEYKANIFILEVERTFAKNFASRKANGEYLLFLDSDMVLDPDVIEECLESINGPDVGGIIIPEKTVGTGFWIKVRDFERSFYFGTKIESARFFRTREVMLVGGFDEDIILYEESTLPQKIEKIGLKTDVRIKSFIHHDEGTLNIKEWLKKKRYYSNTSSTYMERYTKYSQYQMCISYRIKVYLQNGNWEKLLRHPCLAVGLFVLKTLEFFSSRVR